MELTINEALKEGLAAHKKGELSDAKRFYESVLQSQPGHPAASHNLGLIAISKSQFKEALPLLKTALDFAPNVEQFWLSYIDALIKAGQLEIAKKTINAARSKGLSGERFEELLTKSTRANTDNELLEDQIKIVLKAYKQGRYSDVIRTAAAITQEFPKNQFCWKALSISLKKLGRFKESLAAGEKSVELAPQDAEAHYNLGNTLRELGRFEEAEECFKQAIALQSDFTDAHYNLGQMLQAQNRFQEAEVSYKKAIAMNPNFAEAYSNLGNTLRNLHRFRQAEACFNQAIAVNSDYAEAYYNFGNMLLEQGRFEQAERNFIRAIALKSGFALAYLNLGNALQKQGRLSEAEENYRKALVAEAKFTPALSNLGNILSELGMFDDAESSYLQAIALDPSLLHARSNFLFLNASVRFDPAKYLEEARSYSEIVASQIGAPYSEWSCSQNPTVLRIGFVSGDFKQHPVGYFLEGLLSHLQSSAVELYAYTTNNLVGEFTDRLKGLFHSWVSIAGQSDKDAAQNIHNDGIHILIDLSGHTSQNRLPIFGWRPAPVQVSWLGYFASTGLPQMDFILGDPFVTPESEAHHFTEKIWQLPESYLCFTPPAKDLAVGPLPALANGFLTFGCFNSLSRMTDEVVSVRAEILRAVPNSKLFLKDKRLDHLSGRSQVLSRFAAHGIGEDRFILEGRSSREDYLACYHGVDIALSPFPYGGGTTSIEGLWMGVPVIAKKGDYFLSHLGESIAHNANLPDWLAIDNDDYVAKAVRFSSDLSALESLRCSLRNNLLKTPLYDLKSFAVNFENALWEINDLCS